MISIGRKTVCILGLIYKTVRGKIAIQEEKVSPRK